LGRNNSQDDYFCVLLSIMPNIIKKHFPGISDSTLSQIEKAGNAYKEWNQKINVISRKDIDHLYLHHFLHSMSILKCMGFDPGTTFIDVGSGGGFPGIPLAICLPDCEFLLVDSIGKKLKVAEAVCEAAGIENVRTMHSRAEQVKEQCDFVTGRAVETLREFYLHTRHLVSNKPSAKDKGILYLKGGELKDEIRELKRPVKGFSLQQYINEEYFETKKLIYIPI
jgi:16S rRNA (guanine527-N7)-methyltransferase